MENKEYQVTTNPLETGPLKATLYLTTKFKEGPFDGQLGSEFIADFETEEKANEICALLNSTLKAQQGGVWVKAETHVPDHRSLVHLNYGTDKTRMKTTGYYEVKERQWYRQDGYILDWSPNLRWLDETSASPNAYQELKEDVSGLEAVTQEARMLVKTLKQVEYHLLLVKNKANGGHEINYKGMVEHLTSVVSKALNEWNGNGQKKEVEE